ncbi:phosphate ABC transporter permease subunit PstC [Tomitella fengzijianii]|uniref:Phosphate transport system permease protein n=1 Tax=Tomitella fengzijianii TaxID=2597660 RepID=A0A516X7L4_9ACTN|nr:phosphate ABC transporter permease subunit PstC [Tomitella fengzijianii]
MLRTPDSVRAREDFRHRDRGGAGAPGGPGPGGRFGRRGWTGPSTGRTGDRVLRATTKTAAVGVSAMVAAIGVFLAWRAVPALQRNEANFLTSHEWSTTDVAHLAFGIADLLALTVMVSVFALALAMPVSFGIAVFVTRYAPRRLAGPVAYVVDLLAAVPSVVYGLWGLLVLAPALEPVATWLNSTLGWLPLFAAGSGSVAGGGTVFTAGIVLALMIVPVITGVTREVFLQTPREHVEAALALGATRWEVVRTAVLPFGRSGFIGASMLGLGRALGETMALYMVLQTTSAAFGWSLFDSGASIASKIALGYAEFNNELQAGAYIAAGLVLFALTFVVGAGARMIAARGNGGRR